MAGAVAGQSNDAKPAGSPVARPRNRMPKNLLIIGAVVLGLVTVQSVATYLLMPGPVMRGPAISQARLKQEEKNDVGRRHGDGEDKPAQQDYAEVPLGDFSFSNTIALRNVISHVNFRLAALASANQASIVESQTRRNQERIREAVNKIVRNANLEELYDPNLEAIKRSVCEEINKIIGKRLVVEVVINDIRVIQQ